MKEHQIKVVPVDLDPATMMPCVEDVKKALSAKTKACLFAYIFGVTYDIAPFVEMLNAANVEIIEDCAQSFRSLEKFRGSDFATMTMFSFGLIKYNTAFYGAVTIFRNLNETHRQPNEKLLCQKVEEIQQSYATYTAANYEKKITSATQLFWLIQKPWIVNIVSRTLWALGKDIEESQIHLIRGFPASNEPYLMKFRVKPSAPLIKMIIDRTKNYSQKEHLAKCENFNRFAVSMSTNGFFVPGYAMVDRSYWLCPFVVPNRELFKDFCNAQGVFCYLKSTQICAVEMPKDKLEQGLQPVTNCHKILNNIVYAPVNPWVPKKDMDVTIRRLLGICYRYQLLAEFKSKQLN